jgi:hypothetical protein
MGIGFASPAPALIIITKKFDSLKKQRADEKITTRGAVEAIGSGNVLKINKSAM